MSRRAPGADHAEQNRATLKQLVKLESNKSCADCKRNKHPRWASWNIGVFVCIRCSGIHRGMGTHISRVKSVDLDSWTDEQLQSMVKWGNARANKYWEHKLAEGHVPNEAKIENFIRTKYDSKRWVMDGPIPDPSSLEDDDELPLSVVQERARSSSGAGAGVAANSRNISTTLQQPPNAGAQQIDLFGDSVPSAAPARPSTTEPVAARAVSNKPPAVPAKQNRPGESLLGLDFFGSAQSSVPARPSSVGPNAGNTTGRSDLKQSILSLYASKPAAPPTQSAQPASNIDAFGGMSSPPLASPSAGNNANSLGGLGDAFSSLSFGGPTQSQTRSTPFAGFSPPATHNRQPSIPPKQAPLSGGGFFDTKPAPKPAATITPAIPTTRNTSFGGDFGDFSTATLPTTKSPPPPSSSNMGDLFDLSAPAATTPKPAAPIAASKPPPISAQGFSAFNLTQVAQASTPKPTPVQPKIAPSTTTGSGIIDPWGSTDAWAAPDPPQSSAPPPPPPKSTTSNVQISNPTFTSPPQPSMTAFDNGWGDPEPPRQTTSSFDSAPSHTTSNTTTSAGGFSVQQDEEFGGWSHASPVATPTAPKQGGVSGNSDDLFGNVWG